MVMLEPAHGDAGPLDATTRDVGAGIIDKQSFDVGLKKLQT